MSSRFPVVLVLLGLASTEHACAAPAAAGKLTATVSPGKKKGTVRVEYRNGTGRAVRVNRQVIESGVLALEVLDGSGRVVPPVPPPVPSAKPEEVVIPAGEARSYSYTLNHFSPPLPPGRNRVRTRLKGWGSNAVVYVVGGGKGD